MQVVFHIGAPCTDDDRLIKSLLRNREALARDGIAIPTPVKLSWWQKPRSLTLTLFTKKPLS